MRWLGEGPHLFDRTDADTVGLAQSAVDGSCLRDAHLSAMHKERNIGRIGVTISDETATGFGLVDRSLECPALCRWVAERLNSLNVDTCAPTSTCQARESRMGNVPPIV